MITVMANARSASYMSDDVITSGSVGIQVTFMLSADFDGLSCIAVFEGSGAKIDVALMNSNTCVVPHEVLAQAGGYLRIGVYASNGEGTIVIPTVWARSRLILSGTTPSEVDPYAPTPGWVAQVQEAAAEALANSEEAIEIAGGADAAAEEARQSASAAAASATAAGQSASAAGTAQAAAETAQTSAASARDAAVAAQGSAESSAQAAAGSATEAAGSAAAAAASEAAAREVEESIPQDYADLSQDVVDLKSQISPIMDSTKTGVDLDISDPSGNVLLRLKNGGIQTKYFDSANIDSGICYVSPNGSDTNDGRTESTAFATFQHAIDIGCKNIIAAPGEYKGQQISMDGLHGISIISNSNTTEQTLFESHVRRTRAKIDNSIDVTGLTAYNSIYRTALTVDEDSSFYKVFISKTLDPVYSGSAYYGRVTTYNAILWEITDGIEDSTRLIPKLTLADCEANTGSFYFDGSYLYINPTGGVLGNKAYKRLNLDTNQYGINIRNCTDIHIQGIDVAFFPYYDLRFAHCEAVMVKDCCCTFTSYGSAVEVEGADATFISCVAAKAGADGFGIAAYGNVSFYDCSAFYCYDDGISHHDAATGVIDGGQWVGCLKGGVTPSFGSNVAVKNVVCRDNVYGIYITQSGDRVTDATLMVQNCLAVNNTTKDIRVTGYDVISHGCAYGTKQVDDGASLTEYGNTIIA